MNYKFEEMFDADVKDEGQSEAIQQKLTVIGEVARKCLSSSDFQQYKELFQKEKNAIINAMVIYTANFGKSGYENINVYAFNMMRFVQQVTDLRKLLTAVEIDARKGAQPKEENEK